MASRAFLPFMPASAKVRARTPRGSPNAAVATCTSETSLAPRPRLSFSADSSSRRAWDVTPSGSDDSASLLGLPFLALASSRWRSAAPSMPSSASAAEVSGCVRAESSRCSAPIAPLCNLSASPRADARTCAAASGVPAGSPPELGSLIGWQGRPAGWPHR